MIRTARKEDIKDITKLAIKLWPSYTDEEVGKDIETAIDREDMTVLIAEDDKEIVGFARVSLNKEIREGIERGGESYLDGLYVKEDRRLEGFANDLVKACEDWARDMGRNELISYSDVRNVSSVNFHIKNGFREKTRKVKFTKKL